MNLKNALRSMKQLQKLTTVVLCSNIILGAGLVYSTVQLSNKHDRVVLVPPSLDKKAEIAWDYANKEYIKSFALYMATLVGNIQPKSSTVVLDSVSAFMDPAIYTDFRYQLMGIIEDPVFKSSGSVISFLPQSVQFEVETSRVFITGTIITSTAGSTKYQKNVVYEVGVRIREGRPWVSHFTSYEGNQIRTVSWWTQKQSRDGTEIPSYALPEKWSKENLASPEVSDLTVMKVENSVQPQNEDSQRGVANDPEQLKENAIEEVE